MKNRFFVISVFLSLLISCNQPSSSPGEINLSWELVSNTYSEEPQSMARFTIENKSGKTLNNNNWALYYNQMSRTPLSSDADVEIHFLSGDWFVMKPTGDFLLETGDSITITIEQSEWIIKETDAPLSPYIVFYDEDGKEADIVPIDNYTIAPFVKPEQINRHNNDFEPIPTANHNFEKNKPLILLSQDELLPIIPSPIRLTKSGTKVTFNEPVQIIHEPGLENEAQYLSGMLKDITGEEPKINIGDASQENTIFLGTERLNINGKTKEAYQLKIKNNKSVTIQGSDAAGVFYGIQSLISLLPVQVFKGRNESVELDEMIIEDAPRFAYRGLHIDVARNFQTIEELKKIIDIHSFYKCNYLVVYLSEDEGWRIEIDGLPELTEIGSQRQHTSKEANALHPSYGSGPFPHEEGKYGSGYYSKQDFIELLQYANSKHITIIPAINFPGHSRAAIKSMEARYHKYMETGDEQKANEYRLIDPEDKSEYLSAQWYNDNVVNVARESTYRFYEKVVDEIIKLYEEAGIEIEFFQTGGDEVPEGVWTRSPKCAELLKKLPDIKDPKNLQAYFFNRIVKMLRNKDLKIGGWEEVALLKNAEGVYEPNEAFAYENVFPYVWNNLEQNTDLAYRIANTGYPVILCNVSNFYFDFAYNKDPREPGHYWAGFVNTRDAWQVAPFNMFYTTTHDPMGKTIDVDSAYDNLEHLKPSARKNIIGLQAQLWSETIKGPEMLEYYLLPKLMAFAETAWGKERNWETIQNRSVREQEMDKGWNVFANTLAQKELPRLAYIYGGYNYHVPAPGAQVVNGVLEANNTFPGLTIRYSTDGNEPDRNSQVYTEPVPVNHKVKLKAFDSTGKSSLSVEAE